MTEAFEPTAAQLLTLEEIDRRHIMYVVEMCGGNRTNAAQVLDIDRKTLYRKLLRWGVAK
jgi:transcriptional regulator of acetoin/glycerol metabolism